MIYCITTALKHQTVIHYALTATLLSKYFWMHVSLIIVDEMQSLKLCHLLRLIHKTHTVIFI